MSFLGRDIPTILVVLVTNPPLSSLSVYAINRQPNSSTRPNQQGETKLGPKEKAGQDEKHLVVSPAVPTQYFPDDKIVMISHEQPPTAQFHDGLITEPTTATPGYPAAELLARPQRPFWKRHLLWLVGILVVLSLVAGIVIGIMVHRLPPKRTTRASIPANVQDSVASSGLFLKDKTTWNMQTYWQNENGTINYQISTNGNTFAASRNVTLFARPKLTLFYISDSQEIAMCALACAAGGSSCSTIANNRLQTKVPLGDNTGLTVVNVNDSQDWRVHYLDNNNFLSQLQGNTSGFDTRTIVGGLGLNGSSIAAQSTKSAWTIGTPYPHLPLYYLINILVGQPITNQLVTSWNPTSGLGAAYTSTTDQLHVYYTGTDSGAYEFLGSEASTTNTTWVGQPGRSYVWATAACAGMDISAVGWKDQARFFMRDQSGMIMGVLGNGTWSEKFVG
ncbi:hypothetical protein G7Y89_g5943 [Cudoniella acicularis]|uniref:Fucose-specific lectin n=1 Tax=Cudoniella acicularis TaxID=354080 RepID=A0A8H4W3H6_9HELO|nr:hypothetical protein G7Y89_g5943 [Cudoniella acicularis]